MDIKTIDEIRAGQPMTIARLAKDGSVISKESYNMDNDFQVKQLAKALIPACEKFYADPENVRRYEVWKAERKANKQSQ